VTVGGLRQEGKVSRQKRGKKAWEKALRPGWPRVTREKHVLATRRKAHRGTKSKRINGRTPQEGKKTPPPLQKVFATKRNSGKRGGPMKRRTRARNA